MVYGTKKLFSHTEMVDFYGEFHFNLKLVAPFAGSITVDPTDSHTVIIGSEGGSLRGITVYITNIEPISIFDTEEGRSVSL